MILGLTGGTGAGKSAAAEMFRGLGAYVSDADKISRGILEKSKPAYDETVRRFGKGVLNADGTVNRKALAAIVFNDKKELEALNQITHKYIFEEAEREIGAAVKSGKYPVIVIDAPLLFSDDFKIRYDRSAAVIADDEIRIKRIMSRDGMTRGEAEARMKNQLSNAELIARADYVIENNRGVRELEQEVKNLYERLIKQI